MRPGLVFNILGQETAADGTVKVRFKITDPKGVPLDREGINTPGTVSTSFILAAIPADNEFYQSYTTRVKTSTDPATGRQDGASGVGRFGRDVQEDRRRRV